MYRLAVPIDRVKQVHTPFLVIHGDQDESIPLANSIDFCDRMKQTGSSATLAILPGVKHGFGYGIDTAAQKKALEITAQFFVRNAL